MSFRIQNPNSSKPHNIFRVQPQDILHVSTFNISMRDETSQRKIEENTKEILEKIEELNKKQGLVKKKKPMYFHFPFSYSRSQEEPKKDHQPQRTEHDFKFPNSPFENPILQYLNNQKVLPTQLKTASSPLPTGGITVVQTNPKADVTEEDEMPGQYVKRKITHQQVMIVPSVQTYMNNQYNPVFQQYQQSFPMQNYPGHGVPNMSPLGNNPFVPTSNVDKNLKKPVKQEDKTVNLEAQTLNNIKNIIYNSQPSPNYAYPYLPPNALPYYPPNNNKDLNKLKNQQPPAYLYGPYVVPNLEAAQLTRQIQIQSPLYDYFPIMIKDPIMHFFTALTTMVEYGPQAGVQTDPCKGKQESGQSSEQKNEKVEGSTQSTSTGLPFNNQGDKIKYDPEQAEQLNQLLKNLTDDGHISLEFENPNFQDEEEASGRGLNIRFPKNNLKENDGRIERLTTSVTSSTSKQYNVKENKVDLMPPMVRVGTKYNKKVSTTSKTVFIGNKAHLVDSPPSPPTREPVSYDYDTEEDKGLGFGKPEDTQVSHDGNKKLFSKDNTGSGIFIHKLKVRKGGVAIAGPGGIATAGDGGTAIVGPNGYAYTQPDSLAIAGTGTKVIAVEPSINLGELLKGNKSRLQGPNGQRIGKLVAVGPVIYYNKG